MPTFHERLQQLKTDCNILQKTIAADNKISLRAYQYYERGEREPTLSILNTLADYFNVSIDYLVGRTDTPTLESVSPDMPVKKTNPAITVDQLSSDQNALLTMYNTLEDNGQAALLERAEALLERQNEMGDQKYKETV